MRSLLKHSFFLLLATLLISIAPVVLRTNSFIARAADVPYGCPGGPVGPGNPSSCPFTNDQINQFCTGQTKVPAETTVYCGNSTGGVTPWTSANSGAAPGFKPWVSTYSSGNAFQGDCNGGNGVKLGVANGKNPDGTPADCVGGQLDANGNPINPIYAYLKGLIQFAAGIFGILVVLMIIVSGIQYITSSGNPEAVKNAKKRLGNAVLGIILFLLMLAILNYLIPGGIVP